MALIHCDFYSEVLGLASSMLVVLPRESGPEIRGRRHPVLYLLHGLSDDHTVWLRQTAIERYAVSRGLAVVMPNVHRSFYTDMASGLNYWTFISEELPELARSFFPLSAERQANFVAGLSMGGYGAFKLALRCPGKFSAAASLSGALDVAGMFRERGEDWRRELALIFGSEEAVAGSENDLFFLAERLAGARARPRFYQCCGRSDSLLEENRRFRAHLKHLKFRFTYREGPGGHTWDYWDQMIQRVVRWLPVR
ncbi:MAG: esterase family protein [Kiritimatiellae bacterium]|nr:esterase family protein [Kiritimatiellia bacterium]